MKDDKMLYFNRFLCHINMFNYAIDRTSLKDTIISHSSNRNLLPV